MPAAPSFEGPAPDGTFSDYLFDHGRFGANRGAILRIERVKAWDEGGSVEPQLIEAARRGDREAFDAIVRTRLDTVYRTAFTILGHAADAQDATQETFVAAWRNLPGLRDTNRFDAWLGRITINACKMALRRRGTVREISIDLPDAQQPATGGAGPAAEAAEAEVFDRAFARLSVDDRAILVLHHHQELGIAEIADRLAVPNGTVKSRLHRARHALQRALDRENR
jgi:RNA polymerase sigma-70 factor (ECF subfamily)